ncbi:MAG: DUF1593 domain-containing protein [Opitutales bacterium]|nr:DUF1593 domain-containing protein [Opitutales bacterium]
MSDPKIFAVLLFLLGISMVYGRKARTIILADMGNEPDEEQQMTHMLMYCNEFHLEGLIVVSGKYMNPDRKNGAYRNRLHPHLFHELIAEYAKVRDNLTLHADGWPKAEYLHSIVKSGTLEYGIAGTGKGKSTEGSELILQSIKGNLTKGKLYIVVNAGSNTLAQALIDLSDDESISDSDKKVMIGRVCVYENGAQDNSGAWIAKHYPEITWYRSNHQTYAYGGAKTRALNQPQGPYCWEPYPRTPQGQHQWSAVHVQNNHGALGERFPDRVEGTATMEGGGTIPWIGLANHGLCDPWNMWWGGWSGRVSKQKHKNVMSRHKEIVNGTEFQGALLVPAETEFQDFYVYEADSEIETWTDPVHGETFTSLKVPVWRFRRAMWNDFRARMDWCVEEYANANHNPVAYLNGDATNRILRRSAPPGEIIELNAAGSYDPDGDDLTFNWWCYEEAGTYPGKMNMKDPTAEMTTVTIPDDAKFGDEIHIILEVRDHKQEMASDDHVTLTDYRRLVISVK